MTDHFQRSQLLINQGRYDLAEKELRQLLSAEPDYASAHGLLAVCLSEKKQLEAALKEIREAIALSPSYSGFHYIHAGILQEQNALDTAKKAILEALRLDPEDADCHARLASIQYDQHKYTEALKSAEQGLSVDAEHVWSMNMRLLALIELGRIAQAEAEVNSTLAVAPDHPFPHTVKGWVMLHQNKHVEAMESFKEALRLKPGGEWARLGLLESLKARNRFYRLILRIDLWRSRLSTGQRFALFALLLLPQTRALFLLLVIAIGLSKSFFTFLLSFDPYGRLALSPQQIATNQWILAIFGSLGPGILLSWMTQQVGWAIVVPSIPAAAYCGNRMLFAKIPRDEKVKFAFLLALSLILLLFALAYIVLPQAGTASEILAGLAGGLAILAVVGFILWVVGQFLVKLVRLVRNLLMKR